MFKVGDIVICHKPKEMYDGEIQNEVGRIICIYKSSEITVDIEWLTIKYTTCQNMSANQFINAFPFLKALYGVDDV